jgi:hypothetical protein
MDIPDLRQVIDLVHHVENYARSATTDRLDAIYLLRLGPTTHFIVDGTGEALRCVRVETPSDDMDRTFHERTTSWSHTTGRDARPCVIDMAPKTLLHLRDNPTVLETIRVYLAGKITVSSLPLAISLARFVKRALEWRGG